VANVRKTQRSDAGALVEFPTASGGAGASVVGKALGLLDALGSGRPAEPLSALAARTGLPKSTASRILRMMEAQGFVGRKDSLYCLGPRLRELGAQAAVSTHSKLRGASLGVLERLYDQARTTVHLAVLTGTEVLYLEKITAPGGSRIPSQVGLTAPAACTALGKVQLAYADKATIDAVLRRPLAPVTQASIRSAGELRDELTTVRTAGVAVDRGELRPGLSCVAAPIIVHRRVIAALSASSVHGPAYTAARVSLVREAAHRLSTHLERLDILSA
jgi:DNA-binding IclR family transcriptional regulator